MPFGVPAPAGRTGNANPVERRSTAARYSPTAGVSVEMTVSGRSVKVTPAVAVAVTGAGTMSAYAEDAGAASAGPTPASVPPARARDTATRVTRRTRMAYPPQSARLTTVTLSEAP